jgi:protein gp37
MAENTKIEWCDATMNPWIGCTKVSPGCEHCYAESWAKRSGLVQWGPHERRRTSKANWRKPLLWNKKAKARFDSWEHFKATNPGLTDDELIAQGFIKPRRPRVFCGSLCDIFDDRAPDEWRRDLGELISETPFLDWLLLSKRIGNADRMLRKMFFLRDTTFLDGIPRNVWIGATITTKTEADRDITRLLKLPARIRFLSMEPLLEHVDIAPYLEPYCDSGSQPHPSGDGGVTCPRCGGAGGCPGVQLVIAGGETGPKARPVHPEWVRSLRDQCIDAGTKFFFKAWGEWLPWSQFNGTEVIDDPEQTRYRTLEYQDGKWEDIGYPQWCDDIDGLQCVARVGKKRAGRLLDGRTWEEMPA